MLAEETIKDRTDSETAALYPKWHEQTIAEHIIFIKGAEIVFQEFKEIIFDLACKLKDQVEPKTGKMTVVLKKFIEEWLLKRLIAFVKFNIAPSFVRGREASRVWPASQKDLIIKEKQVQMQLEREAYLASEAERLRIEAEQRENETDRTPQMDPAELEELQRKQAAEEEAQRIAREAEEEAALAAESSGSEDESDSEQADSDED